jgi:hypothetical protein
MAELSIQDLYKLFEDNQLSPTNSVEPVIKQRQQQTSNFIKVGDIVVAQFKDQELRGEVNRVYEQVGIEFYDIKVGTTIVPIKFDNIIEHYPKNRKFDQIIKENVKEIESEIVQEKKTVQTPIQTQVKTIQTPPQPKKVEMVELKPTLIEENKNEPKDKVKSEVKEEEPEKVMRTAEEVEEEENNKHPENTNFNETVKVIGKITQFSSNLKLSEVIDFLAKRGIDKEKCWYFITEKNGELHLIRNNDLGFKIQPFVLSFIDLKIKDKLTESKEQIKIIGNNQFSIVSNIPQELYETVKNGLIALLSQTKK